MSTYGKLAAPAELTEKRSLGFDTTTRRRVIEETNGTRRSAIVGTALERECALADLRDHLVGLERLCEAMLEPHPPNAGDRDDDGIDVGLVGSSYPARDVAPKRNEREVRS